MDITSFVVSSRCQALIYGDHATYQRKLSKKLHNCRKKLKITTKPKGNFSDKVKVTAEQIGESDEYLHLVLLTSERAWAHAMRLKTVHSTESKAITGRTRSHIVSRLEKAACVADRLVDVLAGGAAVGVSQTDVLEARAYAAMLRGTRHFENQHWERCLRSYSKARVIYLALSASLKADIAKDFLSDIIDPSIRYAAYQLKTPRTVAISSIARDAFFLSDDAALAGQINKLDAGLLRATQEADSSNAHQTITWRSREVKVEDPAITLALASVQNATAKLAEKLASSEVLLPREMAAAYDDVLIASQDAADAVKVALDELRDEGVSQNDGRVQALQVARTAVHYQMISWRIGRNRVLSGEHDGALLDSAPNTTRKAKKMAVSKKPKPEATGRKIARLKEKVVLYDATLQSLESIRNLPGVAADEGLGEELEASQRYFDALKCLSIARSHSLAGRAVNALALTQHAATQAQTATAYFSQHQSQSSEATPRNIEIRQSDTDFLSNLLKGELQRSRALVDIERLHAKSVAADTEVRTRLVERLGEYPIAGADLTQLVTYPPELEAIPVKPLFFDVAWNYIQYPGREAISAGKGAETGQEMEAAQASQKKAGWFGFGRG